MLASVIMLPPDVASYISKSEIGSPVYNMIASVAVTVAVLPEPFAPSFLAMTVTSKGEFVLSVYE